ncbi:hypothetical protein D3C79_587800 [compost metagenome]
MHAVDQVEADLLHGERGIVRAEQIESHDQPRLAVIGWVQHVDQGLFGQGQVIGAGVPFCRGGQFAGPLGEHGRMQQGVERLSCWRIQCRAWEKRLSILIRGYACLPFAGSGRAVTPALCIDCRTEGVEQVDGKVNTGWRLQQVSGQCGEIQVVVQHQWTGGRSWGLGGSWQTGVQQQGGRYEAVTLGQAHPPSPECLGKAATGIGPWIGQAFVQPGDQ